MFVLKHLYILALIFMNRKIYVLLKAKYYLVVEVKRINLLLVNFTIFTLIMVLNALRYTIYSTYLQVHHYGIMEVTATTGSITYFEEGGSYAVIPP